MVLMVILIAVIIAAIIIAILEYLESREDWKIYNRALADIEKYEKQLNEERKVTNEEDLRKL